MSTDAEKLAALTALIDEWEASADTWGTCSHEWINFSKLRSVLAGSEDPSKERLDKVLTYWEKGNARLREIQKHIDYSGDGAYAEQIEKKASETVANIIMSLRIALLQEDTE